MMSKIGEFRIFDEPRFCLDGHKGRKQVRQCRGETRQSQFDVERHVHQTMDVIVWDAIAHERRSPLVFIRGNIFRK